MTYATIQDSNSVIRARRMTRDSLIAVRYRGIVNVATATEIFIDGIADERLILPQNSVTVIDKVAYAMSTGSSPALLAGTPELAPGNIVSFMGTTFAVTQTAVNTLTDLAADDTNDRLQVTITQGDTVERVWEVYLFIRGMLAHNQEITNTWVYTGLQ